jgi:hypothetical protein
MVIIVEVYREDYPAAKSTDQNGLKTYAKAAKKAHPQVKHRLNGTGSQEILNRH